MARILILLLGLLIAWKFSRRTGVSEVLCSEIEERDRIIVVGRKRVAIPGVIIQSEAHTYWSLLEVVKESR